MKGILYIVPSSERTICFFSLSLSFSLCVLDIAIANMSSLRRILSLECADNLSLPLLPPTRRELARHHSLPALSLFNPQGLPFSPLPMSRFSRSRRRRFSRRPFYCAHKSDSPPSRFASFRSVPAWSADDELDISSVAITRSISRKESWRTEDSVVYRELCDSIRTLEAPSRYVQVLNSKGVLGSTHAHVEVAVCEEEEKKVEPSSIDVRGRPLSLRMLKRKSDPCVSSHSEQGMVGECSISSSSGEARDGMLHDMGGSVNSAFSSLVFMMESLQQHTIWLRRVLMSEADVHMHVVMSRVHQEMQDTFLWLFQKVFSCTPKLMLLTMLLLVDFAVHSMGQHVALGVMPMGEPPTCAIERAISTTLSSFDCVSLNSYGSGSTNRKVHAVTANLSQESSVEPRLCAGGAGDKVVRAVKVGGSMDGEATPIISADRAAMTTGDDTYGGLTDASFCGCCTVLGEDVNSKPGAGLCRGNDGGEHHMLSAMWEQAVSKDSNLRPLTQTGHMLVAPVQAPVLEADDYPCYDRTDLKYQHELSRDPSNPLLLANYAHFLHVVRHDHNRAEVLYKRAVKVDPVDGEVIGKYASFLWVAKEDAEAADEVYKAALAVDPTNVYHAGSYAHFLWNSSSGLEDSGSNTTSYQQVSTS